MSENADKQSKTFEPTPRRIRQARDEGQVAKSREVATAGVVLASGVAFVATGQRIMAAIVGGTSTVIERSAEAGADLGAAFEGGAEMLSSIGLSLVPFAFLVLVVAVLSHVGQTGFLVAPKALLPKWTRVSPFARLKDVLGPVPAGMRALTALLKLVFVGVVVTIVAGGEIAEVQRAATRGTDAMLVGLGGAVVKVLLSAGVALCVVALIDFVYQKRRHIQNLRMTREEVKRESREEEGMPELKGRRKAMHRELSLNRILEEVPKADVVVTNPTHYAVALRYEAGIDVAPRVVAKGSEAMALVIRRIARQSLVPIVENRAVARALWRQVKIGHPIPVAHFKAVAEILTHVYRLKHRFAGRPGGAS